MLGACAALPVIGEAWSGWAAGPEDYVPPPPSVVIEVLDVLARFVLCASVAMIPIAITIGVVSLARSRCLVKSRPSVVGLWVCAFWAVAVVGPLSRFLYDLVVR